MQRVQPPGGTDLCASLNRVAVRRRQDPLKTLAWPSDGMIDPYDRRWIGMALDPLCDTAWFERQDEPTKVLFNLARGCGLLTLGTQLETALQVGLLAHGGRQDLGWEEREFVHHEVLEESYHTQMFDRFRQIVERSWPSSDCDASALDAAAFDFELLRPMSEWGRSSPALLFLAGLSCEEPLDIVQRRYLALPDAARHPLLSSIYRLHTADEGRHLAYARHGLLRECSGRDAKQATFLAPTLVRTWAQLFLAAPPGVRSAFDVPDSVLASDEYHHHYRRAVDVLYSRFTGTLDAAGIDRRRTGPLWDAAHEPTTTG